MSKDTPPTYPTPSYTIRRVLMTPKLAQKLLDTCKRDDEGNLRNNRRGNERRIDRYADSKKDGSWDPENPLGCMSCVGVDGSLLDSQHRLRAIVKSGVTIPWVLFENVNPRARATMDIGRVWTPGDFLSSVGFNNYNRTSSIAKLIFSIENANYEIEPTREELLKEATEYKGDIEWACSLKYRAAPAAAAFAWSRAKLPYFRGSIERLGAEVRDNEAEGGHAISKQAMMIRRVAGIEHDRTMKKNTMIDRWHLTTLALRLIESYINGETLSKMPYFKDNDLQKTLIKRMRQLGRRTRPVAVGGGCAITLSESLFQTGAAEE
jgi:hypothetical protein